MRASCRRWADKSEGVVRSFFESEHRAVLEANGVQEFQYPDYPEPSVDGNNFINATKLREPMEFLGGKVRHVPQEITDENMRVLDEVAAAVLG